MSTIRKRVCSASNTRQTKHMHVLWTDRAKQDPRYKQLHSKASLYATVWWWHNSHTMVIVRTTKMAVTPPHACASHVRQLSGPSFPCLMCAQVLCAFCCVVSRDVWYVFSWRDVLYSWSLYVSSWWHCTAGLTLDGVISRVRQKYGAVLRIF